ncbi:MAG: HD domain-containing protein [Mailhella sp.]|nr:HD domain-containing protein [Mailhella sp.]
MAGHQKISELKLNDSVDSVYLIREASREMTRSGNAYWRLQLGDATGSIAAMVWGPVQNSSCGEEQAAWESMDRTLAGRSSPAWARVQGAVGEFRGPQVTVRKLIVLSEEDAGTLDMADFVAASERSGEDMLKDVEKLCAEEFTHKPWKKFVRSVLSHPGIKARLLTAPAAKAIHHARSGGLLEHSLSVARMCLAMADHYPGLDRQALLAAALLHDIGKIEEMTGPLDTEYTVNGNLLGHIVQGLLLLEPFLERSGLEPGLKDHFRHLVASHHGKVEFGAVKEPRTPEAFALHFADDLDARIDHCSGVLPQPGAEAQLFSARGDSLCQPVHTPGTGAEAIGKPGPDPRGQQGSLL